MQSFHSLQILLIAASLLASRAVYAQGYKVEDVGVWKEVVYGGGYFPAQQKSPTEFSVWYEENWPEQMRVRVEWRSDLDYEDPCATLVFSSSPPMGNYPKYWLTFKRNGQTVTIQPTDVKLSKGDRYFTTEFVNVPRYPPSIMKVECWSQHGTKPPHLKEHGAATITFHPQDPLDDWNPGISPSNALEILKPDELALIQHNQALRVGWKVWKTYALHNFLIQPTNPMMTVEVEKGVEELVGDVPSTRPYFTKWQSVKNFPVPLETGYGKKCSEFESYFSCGLQVPGYLTTERLRVGQQPAAHQAGTYRVRVVLPGFDETAWRMFRIPGIIQDVAKAPLAFPSKAELTCRIVVFGGQWGMQEIPAGSEISVKGDFKDIQYTVMNEDLAEAKDFMVRRTLTKQSDRVRVGAQRRMNVKAETLTLQSKKSAQFTERIQLAVGETVVARGWMEVDSGKVIDEANETNNTCNYQITVHRVQ